MHPTGPLLVVVASIVLPDDRGVAAGVNDDRLVERGSTLAPDDDRHRRVRVIPGESWSGCHRTENKARHAGPEFHREQQSLRKTPRVMIAIIVLGQRSRAGNVPGGAAGQGKDPEQSRASSADGCLRRAACSAGDLHEVLCGDRCARTAHLAGKGHEPNRFFQRFTFAIAAGKTTAYDLDLAAIVASVRTHSQH